LGPAPGRRRNANSRSEAASSLSIDAGRSAARTCVQPSHGGSRRGCHGPIPEQALCLRSVVSRVSATGPCEPAQDRTARPMTSQPTWCDVGLGGAPSGPVCGCNRDGMQGVRGSNPLSSTPTETLSQQVVSFPTGLPRDRCLRRWSAFPGNFPSRHGAWAASSRCAGACAAAAWILLATASTTSRRRSMPVRTRASISGVVSR
jgi:hypothetical protein